MDKEILKEIQTEASDRGREFHEYHNFLHIEYKRKKKRLLNVPHKHVKIPQEWNENRLYNPFYVLKNAKKIARSISIKIKNSSYIPTKPIRYTIKKSGKEREVSLFQLPDSAVSYLFYKSLLRKNRHRFSSFAYAYRNDRNIHFAIQDISNEIRNEPRIFIAEFDFSRFFQSIKHEFIYEQLDKNCFLISKTEKEIIKSFLHHEEQKGIPLGTSISLFIANLVCWELDRKLEDRGLRFARYADDTIIWSRDYSKICSAFHIINDFSSISGVPINFDKSDGISVLQKKGLRSELVNPKNHIDFLGYSVSADHISIKKKSV
ncbi:reverse transcriptase domain-containing protein, partial [Spirosoma pomorum]